MQESPCGGKKASTFHFGVAGHRSRTEQGLADTWETDGSDCNALAKLRPSALIWRWLFFQTQNRRRREQKRVKQLRRRRAPRKRSERLPKPKQRLLQNQREKANLKRTRERQEAIQRLNRPSAQNCLRKPVLTLQVKSKRRRRRKVRLKWTQVLKNLRHQRSQALCKVWEFLLSLLYCTWCQGVKCCLQVACVFHRVFSDSFARMILIREVSRKWKYKWNSRILCDSLVTLQMNGLTNVCWCLICTIFQFLTFDLFRVKTNKACTCASSPKQKRFSNRFVRAPRLDLLVLDTSEQNHLFIFGRRIKCKKFLEVGCLAFA